jgi:casein kinase II subunit alpha
MRRSTPKVATYRAITTSRIYRDVNSSIPRNSDPFADYKPEYSDIERFEIIHPIGHGKYCLVFLGRFDGNKQCAIKALKHLPFSVIRQELSIMKIVASVPNVLRIIAIVQDPIALTISIITEYHPSENPRSMFPKLRVADIRSLIFQLLIALDSCASLGVMHRDVKPANLLICREARSICLIDWGLADIYQPERPYTVRVSTLPYKAPELLLNYQYYDYGVDVWGAGCVLGEMLTKIPLFGGGSVQEMVAEVANLCGGEPVRRYAEKYGLELPAGAVARFPPPGENGWARFRQCIKRPKYDDDAVNLLERLLTVDHAERITAAEALVHPFFDPIR